MLTFTTKSMHRFNNRPGLPGLIISRVRFRTFSPLHSLGCLLAVVFLLTVPGPAGTAEAIEFVTREAFHVEKSSYKAYPYRVLFEKFQSSTGAEKRQLRNIIILKQVFDPEIRQRAIAAGAKFETLYGVIKAIDGNSLRLWLPESDSFKDLPVGIDRIPIENKRDYPVKSANIGKFAAIVHTLDDRVYLVEISFALTAPDRPQVARRGKNNVVSWQPPQNGQSLSGYQVFVNNKLYKTITGTSIEVPRSVEQADEFYVKAIYTHRNGRIASAASPTLYDAASAKEIKKRQEAGEIYVHVAAALERSDLPAARKLIDTHQALLIDFLSPDRKAHVLAVAAFFKALDTGDRLLAQRPVTAENLSAANQSFGEAAAAANRLPADFKLGPVANRRQDATQTRRAEWMVQQQKAKAQTILTQIAGDLKPGQWEQARRRLYQQTPFLQKHLDTDEKGHVGTLNAFFQAIDKGDLSAGIQPPGPQHLEAAIQSYQAAEKASHALPANLDAGFIARQRIKATANRQAALASELQARQASQTWDKLLVALNPSEWQSAQKQLYANRTLFTTHLPPENKTAMVTLVDFFTSLDEGDRLVDRQPATMENLDAAAGFYQRAAQKAETLPPTIDVAFITAQKNNTLKKLKGNLQSQLRRQASKETFGQITTALDTGQWREARRLLYAKQDLLTTHLDDRSKADCITLIGFFRDIDEGDRLAGIQPLAMQNLDAALEAYRRAVAKGQSLPTALDTGLIARQKIRTVVESKELLAKGQQQALARKTYDQIVFALAPGRWSEARKQLMQSRDLLRDHLEPRHKATTDHLLEFFSHIDTGDRLLAAQPETLATLEKAAAAYQQASDRAATLTDIADLTFLVTLKSGAVIERKKSLVKKQNQVQAEQTYAHIVTFLDSGQWREARKLIYERQDLLTQYLDPQRRADCLTLAGFFRSIDKGDRLAEIKPPTGPNLDTALESYRQAVAKGQTLPAALDVGLIARQKIRAVVALKDDLTAGQKSAQAQAIYTQIVQSLTTQNWPTGRTMLTENETLLSAELDPARKATIIRLLAFFQFIADGDRLTAQQPVTADNLNMALSSYRLADQKARDLAPTVDLTFITAGKLQDNKSRQADLDLKSKQANARVVYSQIGQTLTPGSWEKGMRMSLDRLPPEINYLPKRSQANAQLLVAFFQDIETGDRLRFQQPEIDSNLAQAQNAYNQAANKAKSLAPEFEIRFIIKARVEALGVQRAALVKREQARMAAQEATAPAAAVPPPAPPPAPVAATAPADDFDHSATGKAALKLGMKSFSRQKYDLAKRYFGKVYAKQIGKLKKAGKKQSFTILGLHPAVRAEVIFLVQLDLLKESSAGDVTLLEEGLNEMLVDIEDGAGVWSIIKERKRNKILKHIERYPF